MLCLFVSSFQFDIYSIIITVGTEIYVNRMRSHFDCWLWRVVYTVSINNFFIVQAIRNRLKSLLILQTVKLDWVRWRSMLNGETDVNKNNLKKGAPNRNHPAHQFIHDKRYTHMFAFYMFSNCRYVEIHMSVWTNKRTSEQTSGCEWVNERADVCELERLCVCVYTWF